MKHNRTITTFADDYIGGGLFISLASVGLFAYIPILVVIVRTNEFVRQPFYKFIISLGVSDITTSLGYLVLGGHLLSHGAVIPSFVTNIVANIHTFLWFSLEFHLLLIAFNRYCCVNRIDLNMKLFEPTSRQAPWIPLVLLSAFLANLPWYVAGGFGYAIDGYFTFAYMANQDLNKKMFKGALIFNGGLSFGCLAFYGAIFSKVRSSRKRIEQHRAKTQTTNPGTGVDTAQPISTINVERRQSSDVGASSTNRKESNGRSDVYRNGGESKTRNHGNARKSIANNKIQNRGGAPQLGVDVRQVKMAFQSGFLSLFFFISTAFYTYALFYSPNKWFSFVFTGLVGLFNSVINPFIYLAFNSKLREKVRAFFH